VAAGLLAADQGGLLLGQAARSVTPLEAALDLAVQAIGSSAGERVRRPPQ
jgi:hypothetical protein